MHVHGSISHAAERASCTPVSHGLQRHPNVQVLGRDFANRTAFANLISTTFVYLEKRAMHDAASAVVMPPGGVE